MKQSSLDALIAFYESLGPDSIAHFADYYADDAFFKDPFNEVRGLAPIQRIFTHMFVQVSEPRFVISERVVDENGALLVWDFHFHMRLWGRDKAQVIHGVSHLRFNAAGLVVWHRDYWDAAEELYTTLPGIGWLMRRLKKAMAS
ncbi:MAG: nuclear transport factor 2 family protein [Propionivibrio sp.]|nr:nuclear transport factor 2 family protein [Propionivibrio sp.]